LSFVAIPLLLLGLSGPLAAWPLPARSAQTVRSPDRLQEARQHNKQGIALARQGNYLEAVSEFRTAIEIAPDDAEAHYNLGLTLDLLGESDQAREEFRLAARLRPASSPIYRQVALALPRQQKAEEEVREFQQVIKLDPKWA
jgi:Flp pilus assembly protein TadD